MRFGWSQSRCFRQAQVMAPELFGDLDVSVPRRWRRDEPKPKSGRPARLNEASLRRAWNDFNMSAFG
eukprot:3956382-Amphidinium_carterae.1